MAKSINRAISYGISSISSRRLTTITFTTQATPKKKTTELKSNPEITHLYRRLSALGMRRNDVNAADILNDWTNEGKSVTKDQIIGFIYQLRKYRKYQHALQLFEWLDERGLDLSYGDLAVRLDLICKAEGIDAVENYFVSLPESLKNKYTYGALLNCYCKEKLTEKAMSLLDMMKKLNFASTALVYNNIISLHMSLGEPEKVSSIVQEMKEKGIAGDAYTYIHLMNSYAALNDIDGAEGVIEKMKKDGVGPSWDTYATLATIFVKAGKFDKANATLEVIEKRKDLDRKAYHILMGLYSHTSNRLGVDRVWSSLNLAFPKLTNMCHLCKLQTLHRMGDKDGLKNHYQNWESGSSYHDIRLANVLIESYLTQDMIKEAEAVREAAVRKGANANFKTLELFINFYLEKHQLDSALKCFETNASKVNILKWKPRQDIVSPFLKYLEKEKDANGAEQFFKILEKFESVDSEVYDSLIRTYIAAGRREPGMLKRMEEDGIEISPTSKKLIENIC
ncbi:hypothetical protein ACHQM5_026264 [Ranunculus cassubicifolius]